MKRNKMETALIKDVENWELPDLIEWARDKYEIYLRGLSNEQLDREYETFLALSEEDLEAYLEDD
jgi:molybdenum cofactor biosynthesis enzyme MoaA